jgi:hypothetical protein
LHGHYIQKAIPTVISHSKSRWPIVHTKHNI